MATETEGATRPRLYLLDGHNLAYRNFFALPADLATSTGQVTNAVYGFTASLIKLLTDEKPDLIAAAFDVHKPVGRIEKYAEYKAGRRETPDEFRQQLPLIFEVLDTLKIPMLDVEGYEADDVIGSIAVQAHRQGIDVSIVTGDRDFFQLVRPGIEVLYLLRGVANFQRYDVAKIEERFGLPPEKYLDYVALKGDTSDNIPGVPGVGEKTASKLIQDHGSVEDLLQHTDELKGRVKAGVEEAGERLLLNKDLVRLETDLPVSVEPEAMVMGEWDRDAVRRLFNSLEFKTLLDRLEDVRTVRPQAEAVDLDVEQLSGAAFDRELEGDAPVAVALRGQGGRVTSVAVSSGGGRAAWTHGESEAVERFLADAGRAKWVHDAKEVETALLVTGRRVEGIEMDTLLGGYLLEPGDAEYGLRGLAEKYLGQDVIGDLETTRAETGASAGAQGDLFADASDDQAGREVAAEAAAVALLAPEIERRVERAGLTPLLRDVEMPLASVLARMQARGIALDVEYLREMSSSVQDRMATLRAEIYQQAGEEFNLNSPPQLRVILFEKLGLSPGKKTPKGQISTDASVLEKIRDQHPIIDALLRWRELDKLNSTYLEALPRLVNPETGRVHTTFNQVSAATGRLSSVNPNLQNIPVRGEEGRRIRRAFVAEAGKVLLVADYSQIELRIMAHLSGDEGLREAFESGLDIHTATSAKVFGLPPDAVDKETRSRAKMVNYGLAYGMNAWGLASRLGIATDEAQEIIDAYFAGFPRIRDYLDAQVSRAKVEGFTETILGRRRYIPELQANNPRVRDLGKRMALNAPIQGSASDVFKVAMIKVDAALDQSGLDAQMLLTVHDELVFEVAEPDVEQAAKLVKGEMEAAYDLSPPLRSDVGWGPNWAEAVPAGH